MTLSEEEIEKLWRAFYEHQSNYYVAARCNVSPKTVRKYRTEREWDERLRQIRAKANALADSNDVLSLAEDIEVTHELQMELYEAIVEQLEAGTYKITISDYIRLVRLEQDLRGSFDRIFEL